ncbi:hypothetical protein IWW36_000739 [Coemansia brasiliensis]|uniref:CAP-Gly domain-containing protein n=1 Tax=Coemansia brasiliensis TaxID=2650707 RepID=A0A9W8M2B3_9FUNG|nr:hypothetical protein IWW36_000739 [Coemansia brasiliensis]
MGSSFLVGRWFVIDGDTGIVRYQGPVDGTQGEWLGVEWSQPGRRGKHLGTKNNKQYFKCEFPHSSPQQPTGSFIRNIERINWGTTLLSAARARYIAEESDLTIPSTIDGRHRGKIEAPRLNTIMNFQRDFSKLTVLGLDNQNIYGSLETDNLSEFHRVSTLLLAQNFISQWGEVERILKQIPTNLHTLDISANPLYSPLEISPTGVGKPVHSLRLDNSPFVDWHDVCRIACSLQVCSLSHGWSQLKSLDTQLPDSIEELKLECNLITDISSLGQLRNLRLLDISGNPSFTHLAIAPDTFTKLESLDISQTGISSWSDIDELNKLPSLHSLKTTPIPLLQDLPEESARSHLIAHLPHVQKLDGSLISSSERIEMERYFLLLRARDILVTLSQIDDLQQEMCKCPRTKQLVQKHGMPSVSQSATSNKLEARLVQVTIQVAQDLDQQKPNIQICRKLIQSMLVRQLRPIGMRLAKTRNFSMFIQTASLDTWSPLDADNRELSFYGIDDNSLVRIIPN